MSCMIVDFCGGDGTGKTTAYEHFCELLEQRRSRVLRTREVGSPLIPVCAELRRLILNPEYKMDGRAMELVFAAMRIENHRYYQSVKDRYDYIVSDRGWLCHLAYTDHNVSSEFTERLYVKFIEPLTYLPDRVYLFHVDQDVATERRARRGEKVDAIEAKGEEFQNRVAGSYLYYADIYGSEIDVRLVDTSGTKEEMRDRMRREVSELCGGIYDVD